MNTKKLDLITEGINKAISKEDLQPVNQKILFLFSKELAHSLIIKLKHLQEAPADKQEKKKVNLQKKLPIYCYA